MKTKNPIIKILFLAANPKDTQKLRLDEEIREIEQALQRAEFREQFEIIQKWATRIVDLQEYLLKYKPDIVHFSGHGSPKNEIFLESINGQCQPVTEKALCNLFSLLKDNIRCVFLNACFTANQARAIAENIDCVIGMSNSIKDDSSISFATAFYQALAYGRDIKTAFELGCIRIDLEHLCEQDIPQIIALNCDPKNIVLLESNTNNKSGHENNNHLKSNDILKQNNKDDSIKHESSIQSVSFDDIREYDPKIKKIEIHITAGKDRKDCH